MQPTVVAWETAISQADHTDGRIVLPIVLYLSSARLWNENNAPLSNEGVFSRTDAYSRCLDKKHGTELAFGNIQMLQPVSAEEKGGKSFPAYDAILKAVNTALRDELSPDESVIFSTRYSKDIAALKTVEGTVVPFATLSDGYRNVIKIVLDIAARMCMLSGRYFPERHVRYIALNDGVDTLNQASSMDITPFKHILNETCP